MTASDAMGWTVLLILTLMVCIGCTRVVPHYQSVSLPMPALSTLPTIDGHELQCLTDDAYGRLVMREQLIKQDRDAARAILCSTIPECEAEE